MKILRLLIIIGMVVWPATSAASPLSQYFYRLLVDTSGPGKSPYSLELLPSCGTDPTAAGCRLEPVCGQPSPLCAPPRWSQFRGGWVRVERRETAAGRLYNASQALVRTATYLMRCTDAWGRVLEDCQPVRWPEGPRSLACAMYGSSIWESGYREDIMTGAPPKGRGPDGEACVMQVMPQHYAIAHADWLTAEERRALSPEQFAEQLLGTDQASLGRCYRIGGRMLARARRVARHQCHGSWLYSMYSIYGTGGKCAPPGVSSAARQETEKAVAEGRLNAVMLQGMAKTDWALARKKSYEKCMRKWPDGIELPEWAERE